MTQLTAKELFYRQMSHENHRSCQFFGVLCMCSSVQPYYEFLASCLRTWPFNQDKWSVFKHSISLFMALRLFQWVLIWFCAPGELLPGHADVPGSNPGRTLYSKCTLSGRLADLLMKSRRQLNNIPSCIQPGPYFSENSWYISSFTIYNKAKGG